MAPMTCLRLGRLEISGSVLFGLALITWTGQTAILPVFAAGALLHELGHCLAAVFLGVPIRTMRISLVGAELLTGGSPSPLAEGLILAAGPGVNLLQGLLCARLDLPLWAGSGLLLGLVNLLPVEPLDGGGLLRLGAERILSPAGADRLCRWAGWLSAAGVLTAGGWTVHQGGSPLLLLFGCWLVGLQLSAIRKR